MPFQTQKSNTYLQHKQTETKGEILNNDAAIHWNLTHSPFVTGLFDKQIARLGIHSVCRLLRDLQHEIQAFYRTKQYMTGHGNTFRDISKGK